MTDLLTFAEPRKAPAPPSEPEGFELPPPPEVEPGRATMGQAWIVGDVGRWLTEDPPPVRWLVEGLIPAGSEGVLAARAGAGKSMTALSIAMGLASGLSVMGRPVIQGEARGVLFVGLEDDQAEFHRRFRRGMALLEEDPDWTPEHQENLSLRLVPLFPNRTSGASFDLESQWEALVEKATAIPGGCGLIILDTLARMVNGDENSAKDTRPFNEAVSALAQATEASVLSIHHVGKGHDGNSDKKLWDRMHPEALRGSSALEGAARFIIQMATLSPTEAETAGLDPQAALRGAYVAMHLSKMSAAEKGSTVLLERRQGNEPGAGFLGLHPDSERILAVLQGQSAIMKLNKRAKVLLAIAEHGGLTDLDQKAAAAEIWPDSGNPKGQWDKMLSALRKHGCIQDPFITEAGWAMAETMGHIPSNRKVARLEVPRITAKMQALPSGRGEAEEMEENPSFPSASLGGRNGRKEPGPVDLVPRTPLPAASGTFFVEDL